MSNFHGRAVARACARTLIGAACVAAAASAHATPYELVYGGSFNALASLNLASAAQASPFVGETAFLLRAFFDDATPNLAPSFGGPFNGFRAYAPSAVTMTIGATTYGVESGAANPVAGLVVAIFDKGSFTPGRYGIGLFVDPVRDGAGFIGDFGSASPEFAARALTPTVFGDFYGVGHSSGVCLSGSAPACPHAVTPWLLRDRQNDSWNLTFGNYEADYPVTYSPGALLGPLNTAQIMAVPEPATFALLVGGLAGVVGLARRRRAG